MSHNSFKLDEQRLRQPDYDYLGGSAEASMVNISDAPDGDFDPTITEIHTSILSEQSYSPIMITIAIPYALLWLYLWFQLSEPLTIWCFRDFPSTLSSVPFTFAGIATRLFAYPLEPSIALGSAFFHLYGLFWTMNVMGMSPPSVRRRTEWRVVRGAVGRVRSAVAERIRAIHVPSMFQRAVDVNSKTFPGREATSSKDQVGGESKLWGGAKLIASLIFFVFYLQVWAQFMIELASWLGAFAASLPAFSPDLPSPPRLTSYEVTLSWYMLLVTFFSYFIIIMLSLWASLPIARHLRLLPAWAEAHTDMIIGLFSSALCWLCTS